MVSLSSIDVLTFFKSLIGLAVAPIAIKEIAEQPTEQDISSGYKDYQRMYQYQLNLIVIDCLLSKMLCLVVVLIVIKVKEIVK
jgi:hypothetical protein